MGSINTILNNQVNHLNIFLNIIYNYSNFPVFAVLRRGPTIEINTF